jgi:hypothetical protein
MKEWLRVAKRRDVVARSSKVAAMVGTILIGINYGDRLIAGNILPIEWVKMILTYCVPYCVSTYASVSAVLSAE